MPNDSLTDAPRSRWPARRVVCFLVPLFLLYAYPLGFWPNWMGANQSAHAFLALALYETGEPKLDPQIRDYFFNHDLSFRDGSFYFNKPPGPALLLVPVAFLVDLVTPGRPELLPLVYFGRLLLLTLPFVFFLFWLGRSLERLTTPAVAWGLTLAYALGTGAAAYSSLYFSHQLAAMGLVAAFLLIARGGSLRLLLAGLACGFAVVCEYQTIIIAVILTVFAAFGRGGRFRLGTVTAFVAGAAPMAVGLLLYNWWSFGNPAEVSYETEFQHFDLPSAAAFGFSWPSLQKLVILLFSPALGLFFYSPWLILSVAAAVYAFRCRHPRRSFFIAAIGAGAGLPILLSAHAYWIGGAIAGPRYLVAGVPFLLFPIAGLLAAARKQMRPSLTVAVVATSVVAVLLFAVIIMVNPHVNTDEKYLTQNPLSAFLFPMLGQNVSNFTILSFLGAANGVSLAVHAVLLLTVLVAYGAQARTAARAFVRPIAIGVGAGLVLFFVWTQLGSKTTPIAEYHVMRAGQLLTPETLPHDEDGLVYSRRPEAIAPKPVHGQFKGVSPAFRDFLPDDPTVHKIARRLRCLEDALWHPEGHLLSTDPGNNTVYKFTPGRGLELYRSPSGYYGRYVGLLERPGACGLAFDSAGRLTLAGGGSRQVQRLEPDGTVTVLAERFEGKLLNSPQSVVYRSDGALYFADPPFALPRTHEDPLRELDYSGIFCLKDGKLRLVSRELHGPVGLAFSPDETRLYVGEWKQEAKKLMVFDVAKDGGLSGGRVLFDMSSVPSPVASDGLVLDERGNVYVTGHGGVWVLDPEGRPLGFIGTPWRIRSLAWGGEDFRTLYMPAGTVLLEVRLRVAGLRPRTAR